MSAAMLAPRRPAGPGPIRPSLDDQLAALVRGEEGECLVCGEPVEIDGEELVCPACGSALRALPAEIDGQLSFL